MHNIIMFEMDNITSWLPLQTGIHGLINSATWYGGYIYVVGSIEYCYGNPRYFQNNLKKNQKNQKI